MLNEVEFEWIRQMYIQGEKHFSMHSWWHEPFKQLFELWMIFHERGAVHLATIRDACGGLEKFEERHTEKNRKPAMGDLGWNELGIEEASSNQKITSTPT